MTALSDLLSDTETTRYAALQNRAAIDYLLLAQGHGCQDFEALLQPFFTLTNIQKMREQVKELKAENSNWINELFRQWGLTG